MTIGIIIVRRYCTAELVLSIINGFRYWYQLLSIIITASCLYSFSQWHVPQWCDLAVFWCTRCCSPLTRWWLTDTHYVWQGTSRSYPETATKRSSS